MEDPVHAVLVVGGCEDMADEQFAGAGNGRGFVAEVSVFEQDPGVFFVDADGVFDRCGLAGAVHKVGVHVVDRALAVAAQCEGVGHVAAAVLAQIESVFALVRAFGVAVGDDHFGERHAPECGSDFAAVVVCDIRQNNTFSVVEADVDGPVLPLEGAAVDAEGDSFGLGDVQRLDVCAESGLFLDRFGVVVVRLGLVEWSADFRHVDVHNGLGVGVEYRAEVQRVCVLRIVLVRAVVHQSLLQADFATEPLVVSNSPGVAVDLVHILSWDADQTALLDDFRIFSHDRFHDLQIFHSDQRLDALCELPREELAFIQVHMSIVDFASAADGHDVCDSVWARCVLGVLDPSHHLGLGRLQ